MLMAVGARYLNIDKRSVASFRNPFPLPPAKFNWVTRISNYAYSQSKIIGCDLIGQPISLVCDLYVTRISNCLFNRINSQVQYI